MKKQLQYSLLQSSICVNGLSVTLAPQLSHNLNGIKWVLDYALALSTDLKETGFWNLVLNKSPGASGMIAPGTPKTLMGDQKCFNCNSPHHLSLCTDSQDDTRIKNNRDDHNDARRLT